MQLQFSPYVIVQLIGAFISAASALLAWRKRQTSGGLPLALLFLAVTAWGLSDEMGLSAQL